jgi:GNAT superfamily N-acetyltransferase
MNMYTLPKWRGKGIASALIQETVAFVKGTSAKRIWLHTTEVARPVYERAGFVTSATEMEMVW